MSHSLRTRLALTSLEAREVPAAGLDDVFNAQRYLELNPDVAAGVRAGIISADDHFRRFGIAEGRNPGGLFNADEYVADNADVREAVIRGSTTVVQHFLEHGQFEDRNPNRIFNSRAYLAANSDVSAAVGAGLISTYQHFVEHGQFEDRLIGPNFNPRTYLEDNPDVAGAIQRGEIHSSTEHFINFGRFEGRKAVTSLGTLPAATSFEGTSANSGDKKFFGFTAPATRAVKFEIIRLSGDFAKLEVENAATSAKVLELEPNNGTSAGTATLTAGTTYTLRVRAADSSPAQFRVVITQV